MKKIYTLAMTSAVALTLAGCGASSGGLTPQSAFEMDVEKQCSVKANGIKTVLANAKIYNAAAIKEGVEYRRLNVNNRDLIASVEEALASGAKVANPVHFKSKPNKIKRSKTKLPVAYAAERACKFGLSALAQKYEAESTWRLAVPGDGFKY
jgi:hypothetical protein